MTLFELAHELVATPSVSRDESILSDRVSAHLGGCSGLEVTRVGDNVVARTRLGAPVRVVMAGHLDTVPAVRAVRVEGDTLWGVGAVDMKGGLAVMMTLAASIPEPSVDVTWCFYAREEIARADSGLDEVWRERPDLLEGDVAILGEPTGGVVEAGCQGTMRAVVRMGGIRAHPARPFTGRNAIHRLAPVLTRVAEWDGRCVVLDGCEYVEQLQAVGVEGGIAGNVIPDEATLVVNYRFAPDRDAGAAEEFLVALLDGLLENIDDIAIEDIAQGAPPSLDHPLLARLVTATGVAPRAKVGWTDVARFAEHGVPAANFGPGDPLLAHHPTERLERGTLDRVRSVLATLLST